MNEHVQTATNAPLFDPLSPEFIRNPYPHYERMRATDPGFAVQNGTSNKANYTGEVIGINANGDAGSQSPLNNASSYNGLPSNSLDITMDGAHVADPGCNCDTPVNPNEASAAATIPSP